MRGRLNIEAWLTQFYPLGPSRLTPFQRSRNLVGVAIANMARVDLDSQDETVSRPGPEYLFSISRLFDLPLTPMLDIVDRGWMKAKVQHSNVQRSSLSVWPMLASHCGHLALTSATCVQ